MTVNARIYLSCGCIRSARQVLKSTIPDIGTDTECLAHGDVEVTHTAFVSN